MPRPKNANVTTTNFKEFSLWYTGVTIGEKKVGLACPVFFTDINDLRVNLMHLIQYGLNAAAIKVVGYAIGANPTPLTLAALGVQMVGHPTATAKGIEYEDLSTPATAAGNGRGRRKRGRPARATQQVLADA
jgi:hypothetical protein